MNSYGRLEGREILTSAVISKDYRKRNPRQLALLLGHFEEEGFQTQDSEYTYKIYHSAYGYSVGQEKEAGLYS